MISPSNHHHTVITVMLALCALSIVSRDNGFHFVYGLADSNTADASHTLTSCLLSDSGGYFTASFSMAMGLTRSKELREVWPCNRLFDFTGSADAACSWLDASTVRAVLGPYQTDSNLRPGDSITFRRRPSNDTAGSTASSSVQLSPPVTPHVPVVVLNMPVAVGACDDLEIDLSASWGHLGRPWSRVVWSVESKSNRNLAVHIQQYLAQHYNPSTSRVVLPRSELQQLSSSLWLSQESSLLSISVTLSNYLDQSSSETREVAIFGTSIGSSANNISSASSRSNISFDSSSSNSSNSSNSSSSSIDSSVGVRSSSHRRSMGSEVPLASILGPRVVTMRASEMLQLDGFAQLPQLCRRSERDNTSVSSSLSPSSLSPSSPSVLSLYYQWFVDRINGTDRMPVNDLIFENRDPRRLLLSPYSLRPGSLYLVTMMVQVTDDQFNELAAANSTVEVRVAPGRVVARVAVVVL